jgi:hypothetical protein
MKKGSGEDAGDERVERPFMHNVSGSSSLYGKVQARREARLGTGSRQYNTIDSASRVTE